ncbi:hypothetical protein F0267_00060 [Vibrio coralliilyticus]|uniref:DUF4259 domain-containing protein n=3 Tax=Vibrio TaxID=662 RepID=A0AAN0SK02_9VIBR|nr:MULTISPECIES: hypothetical protein [Vibrio]CAH1582747.1 conserved hypothetical protein [Vibrio jasicida]AIW22515.1 hypothetical protein IX92_25970 [Vibrio coralliilyticus]MCZ2803302.1 hypothetical protein [Vibrio alginolyticus]NOH36611.1 hypothetical protein [Vibrio coralliilyticus]PAW00283.1 hypothetical protein CKJ79_27730 [Vibrio coralliilyticus]
MSWTEQQYTKGNALALAFLLSGLEVVAIDKDLTAGLSDALNFEGDFELTVFLLDKVIPSSEEKWSEFCRDQPYSTCLYQYYQNSLPTLIIKQTPDSMSEWDAVIDMAMEGYKPKK